MLLLLPEQVCIRVELSFRRSALEKIGKMPLEVFDSEQTHNLIRAVVDGEGYMGSHLMEDALDIIEYLSVLITSKVILELVSIWLPMVLLLLLCFGYSFTGSCECFGVCVDPCDHISLYERVNKR